MYSPTVVPFPPAGPRNVIGARRGLRPAGQVLVMLGDVADVPAWRSAVDECRELVGLAIVLRAAALKQPLPRVAFDAIAIDVAAAGGAALRAGLSALGRWPAAEGLLFSEDGGAPEVAALRALRWPNLVVGRGVRAWVVAALPSLARVGRARSMLQQAQAAVPPLPCESGGPPLNLSLGVAESRFRESYIRGMLARTGSRSAAAKEARVPYRTLCKIVQKLRVDFAPSDDAE